MRERKFGALDKGQGKLDRTCQAPSKRRAKFWFSSSPVANLIASLTSHRCAFRRQQDQDGAAQTKR